MKNAIPLILFFVASLLVFSIFSSPHFYAYAQHHGSSPPMATIGDRSIVMNFNTDPKLLVPGQNSQLSMHLTDENSGEKVQHVTYRLTVSKEDQIKVSDFFHSHTGELTILVKNTPSSHIAIGGTFDVLTNAFVPDPSGKLTINGPLFPEAGEYEIDIEITTMDNDKTDLQSPLNYQFVVNSK